MSQSKIYKDYSLVDRIVRCENELKKLKTAQIYGNSQVVGVESNTLILSANVRDTGMATGTPYYLYWWGGLFRYTSESLKTPIARLKVVREKSPSVMSWRVADRELSGIIEVGDGYCDFFFFSTIGDWYSGIRGWVNFHVSAVSNGPGILSILKTGTPADFPDWVG